MSDSEGQFSVVPKKNVKWLPWNCGERRRYDLAEKLADIQKASDVPLAELFNSIFVNQRNPVIFHFP